MSLKFEITGDNTDLLRKLQETIDGVNKTSEKIKESGQSLDEFFDKAKDMGGVIGAMFAINGATDFVKQIATVRGEFQQLEIAFTTILGSKEKADALMAQVADTAATTPFGLQDVAQGTKQLLAYGTASEDAVATLRMLGDIASGVSAPLNDIVYLYGTTMTQGRLFTQDLRQFQGRGIPLADELAKQFKVAKSEVADLVTAGKVGAEEFQRAMQSLAKGSFNNLMAEQSKSITGQISNLEDSVMQMFNEIGKSSEGIISSVIATAGSVVEHYREIGGAIALIVTAYGAYKAAVIAHSVAQRINNAIMVEAVIQKRLATTAGIMLSNADAVATARKTLLTGAIRANTMAVLANTKAMLTNPYVLAAVAITGLVYAVYKYSTALSATEEAQERFNDHLKKSNEQAEEHKSKVANLIDTLQSETATALQKAQAWEALVKLAPKVAEAYDRVSIASAKRSDIDRITAETQDAQAFEDVISKIKTLEKELQGLYETERLNAEIGSAGAEAENIERIKAEIDLYRNRLQELERLKREAEDALKDPLTLRLEAEAEVGELERELSEVKKQIDRERQEMERTPWKISVDFRVQARYDSLSQQLAQAKQRVEKYSTQAEAQETVGQAIARLRQEVRASEQRLEEMRRKGSKSTKAEIEAEMKRKKEAEESLKVYSPNEGKGESEARKEAQRRAKEQAKERERIAKERLEQQRALDRKLIDLELERQQSEAEAMNEGLDKKLRLLELAHAKTMEELDREREDLLANKAVDPVQANLLYQQKSLQAQRTLDRGTSEAYREEAEAMNEYLREYGSYEEKRVAIHQKAQDDIAKATTKGERLRITAKMQEELSNLERSYGRLTTTISRMFADLSTKSKRELEALAREAKALQAYLSEGKWQEVGTTGRDAHGLSEQDFRKISESPKELSEISKQTRQIEEQAIEAGNAFERLAGGIRMAFSAGGNKQQLTKALNMIQSAVGEVDAGLGLLRKTFSTLGDAFDSQVFNDVAEGIGVAQDAMSSAMEGAKIGSMIAPGIGAAVGGVVGGVTSLIGSFAKMKDARHERTIQILQRQIDSLDKSYQRLGRAVDKAYSSDASRLIQQQDQLLRQKQILLRQQIAEERAKKKTDEGKIASWHKEIDSISQTIEDNVSKAKDVIFGSDVQSAISDFAQAYADAWAQGNDRAEASRDFVRKQIRAMILEFIKMRSNPAIQEIRDRLIDFWSDSVITDSEAKIIEGLSLRAQEQMDRLIGENARWLEPATSESLSGSQRGFETMTQDTAKELNGRFTAIQQDVRGIAMTFQEVRNLNLLSIGHLESISRNTAQLYGIGERLEAIERNTRSLK